MLPLGHLVVGYVLTSLFERLVRDEPPPAEAVAGLLFGTQLPDLIDKPLAWWLGVLPSGRSLAHSLLFAIPIIIILSIWLSQRDRGGTRDGFVVGYGSHLLTDALTDLDRISFLFWPVTPAPVYNSEISGNPLPTLAEYSGWLVAEIVLGMAVVVLWIVDGYPGVSAVRSTYERIIDRLRECR